MGAIQAIDTAIDADLGFWQGAGLTAVSCGAGAIAGYAGGGIANQLFGVGAKNLIVKGAQSTVGNAAAGTISGVGTEMINQPIINYDEFISDPVHFEMDWGRVQNSGEKGFVTGFAAGNISMYTSSTKVADFMGLSVDAAMHFSEKATSDWGRAGLDNKSEFTQDASNMCAY